LVSTKAMSSEDQARDVASRWKLGTGQELRDYPAIMFLDIFGKEEGFVTYREVKRVMNKKTDESIGHRFGVCEYHSSLRQVSRELKHRLTHHHRHRARPGALLRSDRHIDCKEWNHGRRL
jgi:hypothetical protein